MSNRMAAYVLFKLRLHHGELYAAYQVILINVMAANRPIAKAIRELVRRKKITSAIVCRRAGI